MMFYYTELIESTNTGKGFRNNRMRQSDESIFARLYYYRLRFFVGRPGHPTIHFRFFFRTEQHFSASGSEKCHPTSIAC